MGVTAIERRDWARESLRGVQNITFPSFTPDLSELDEEGIRWDVRQAVAHGFFATLCACETGLTFDEARRFVSIVCDEASGKLLVAVTLLFDSLEQNLAMAYHAADAGCDLLQIGFPPNYYPDSEEQIFQVLHTLARATELGVILYPSPHYNFERFHPSAFPPAVLERLSEPGLAADMVSRFGGKLLINNPIERQLPLMVLAAQQQYIGPGCYEAFQSPEQRNVVDYFALLRQGKTAEAMEIYWKLTPARGLFEAKMMPTAMLGCYHWPLQKYYQWLTGGNGGYTRQPCMKLHQFELEPIKFTLMQLGIMPRQPDEEFYIGRANRERGLAARKTL
ncbi:MAG: dihydrodipicolinate synthase family protein [Pseudomonadales bacterium]|nr:dihydrodipicolinate synthase family protein [Pseudomonadales bacterium]